LRKVRHAREHSASSKSGRTMVLLETAYATRCSHCSVVSSEKVAPYHRRDIGEVLGHQQPIHSIDRSNMQQRDCSQALLLGLDCAYRCSTGLGHVAPTPNGSNLVLETSVLRFQCSHCCSASTATHAHVIGCAQHQKPLDWCSGPDRVPALDRVELPLHFRGSGHLIRHGGHSRDVEFLWRKMLQTGRSMIFGY
jgi:hypothetical protein